MDENDSKDLSIIGYPEYLGHLYVYIIFIGKNPIKHQVYLSFLIDEVLLSGHRCLNSCDRIGGKGILKTVGRGQKNVAGSVDRISIGRRAVTSDNLLQKFSLRC